MKTRNHFKITLIVSMFMLLMSPAAFGQGKPVFGDSEWRITEVAGVKVQLPDARRRGLSHS